MISGLASADDLSHFAALDDIDSQAIVIAPVFASGRADIGFTPFNPAFRGGKMAWV